MQMTLPPHVNFIETRHGSFFVLATDNSVSQSLLTYSEFTESEIVLLSSLLRPGDNVVDIGAFLGSHTVPLAKAVGPNGRVLAFEPQSFIFQMLAANVLVNNTSSARIMAAGCGASQSVSYLPNVDYSKPAKHATFSLPAVGRDRGQPIPVYALDDVFDLPELRLIKIDVEGMEIDVLRGAECTIRRHRPFLFVENEWPDSSEQQLLFFEDMDYVAFWHSAPLFNPNNYRAETRNIYAAASCISTLYVPAENGIDRPDLTPVSSVKDHPRRTLLAKARRINDIAADAHTKRGIALRRLERFNEALLCFDKAIAANPGCLDAIRYRAELRSECADNGRSGPDKDASGGRRPDRTLG